METSRDKRQRPKKSDSVEVDATAVTAWVEAVEPQSPGEPHHHHEGTESYIPGSLSHQKQLEDLWEVGTRIPHSADHLGYFLSNPYMLAMDISILHGLQSGHVNGFIGREWMSS
ncbi:hypothetical protein Scep_004322 [Stephania cephalantha]|uniref:Uncharacterized protein n=1 Tax=Stephania cephalantha TaxID=152367 RepID=A0AAP0PVB5_9MAGN